VNTGIRNDSVLSDDDVASFKRDGYVILDDPCDATLVDTIAEEFDEYGRSPHSTLTTEVDVRIEPAGR
jgi:hypothetical protein